MRKLTKSVVFVGTMLLAFGCAPKRVTADEVVEARKTPAEKAPTAAATQSDGRSAEAIAPLTVYFELDSANLNEASQQALTALAEKLRARGEAAVELEGHTCEMGTEEYNLVLGNRRAQAARDYLKNLGVPEARMNTVSYGELRPLAPGTAPDALAKNRRTEVKVSTARAQR